MYGINAGIPKTLVKYLIECEAQNIAQYSKALNEILNTEISPELLPPDAQGKIAQKTQELIGPYLLHDFFLYYTIRFGYDPKKTFALAVTTFKQKYTPAQIKKYLTLFLKRFFANQFKRNCMPDSIKVGSVSLSPRADWRMPSQASVKQWLDF
jgi:NAD+ synthase (glutamine-hydrolysing)